MQAIIVTYTHKLFDAMRDRDIPYGMITTQEQSYLDRDFSKDKVSRAAAEKFSAMQRGSIRLSKSLFRTEDEQEAFIKSGLAIRLPGVRHA